jgi:peptide-methionine (R)-S-oxide reductase
MASSGDKWRAKLSEEQYRVLREKATEPPFSGKYVHHDELGTYSCAACGQKLFHSETKFDSGSGWPSFYRAIDKGSVRLKSDNSHGMQRTEVVCSRCGGHLGHVFDDAPSKPTGQRYCINSLALKFKKEA